MSLALNLHPQDECVRCFNRKSNAQPSNVTIHVNQLLGRQTTYSIARDAKVIELVKRIHAETKIPADQMLLLCNRQTVSLFNEHLSDYIESDKSEVKFMMKLRLGHWSQTANEYPVIYQMTAAELDPADPAFGPRFIALFAQTLQEAMDT